MGDFMNKKSISATILILYLALIFSVIGACFSTFVYSKTKVLVESVNIVASDNIGVYYDEELTQIASKLKLSSMELGLKPATGDVDAETLIPSTITDQGTSEGYYATVYVNSQVNFKIVVTNINIKSSHDENVILDERKNIFISIKDVKNSTKSIEENEVELARFLDSSKTEKITFLIWLGEFASDELEGANISFDIEFVII